MILLYFLGGGAALLFLFLYFRLRKADFAKWPNPYDREMKEPYVSLFSTLYRPRPGEERRRREFRGTGGPEIPPASQHFPVLRERSNREARLPPGAPKEKRVSTTRNKGRDC